MEGVRKGSREPVWPRRRVLVWPAEPIPPAVRAHGSPAPGQAVADLERAESSAVLLLQEANARLRPASQALAQGHQGRGSPRQGRPRGHAGVLEGPLLELSQRLVPRPWNKAGIRRRRPPPLRSNS